MPMWCHMFNSTLIGTARVWFDELPPERIYGYKDLKAAFLAYFIQHKKYVKDPVEIHNIKQKDGETIEDFIERFKIETGCMKGALECMRNSVFMHGVNNPELTKRLNEHIPKTVEEMMTTTTAFIRGETAAASKKKVNTPWKSQDQSERQNSEQRPDFRNQPKDGWRSNKFTPLTRTPKEIYATELGKFKPPPPMVTSVEKRSSNKFCEFHNNKGHSTDEYVQLRNQIEELVRAGKLSHFIKEIRQDRDQQKTGKKDAPVKDKAAAIYMIRRSTRYRNENWWTCRTPHIRGRRLLDEGDAENYIKTWMNFMIVRSPSPYNGIIGRPGIREIQAVPSTAHEMLKFLMNGGIVTIRSTILTPTECAAIAATPKHPAKKDKAGPKNLKWQYILTFRTKRLLLEERSSCVDGSCVGLILTIPEGTKFTYALRFQFAASNNKVEYATLIAGLRIAAQMGVHNVYVLVEVLKEKSIQKEEVVTVVKEEGPTWMTSIMEYLKDETLPGDRKEASKLRIKARQYELLEGVLYMRSFLKPWLRCVGPLQANYVIREIHKGSCIAMDYFTKWIEAKAMATITGNQVKKFMWDNIVCRFGLSGEIVSDNGKQFSDNPFKDWCEKLNITQRFASVKHPQSNGLIVRANQSLGEGIKARLSEGNKNWIKELLHVLWAHRTMIKSSHGDTPFSLTYGTKAVIPTEIRMPTYRTAVVDAVHNNEELWLDLDLLEERRECAAIREAKASHAMDGGKLGPKWEGHYKVTKALRDGAYRLRSMDGAVLPRTWNVANLKKCYL
uniref:Reverse transcriptase domain-containing protein n=1 Tax=Tanacetum cinerariifolium TaxID=118510 RepID=A0A699GZ36_TANCI|nr:reverse transcriptase domain-containing protein [Tanacetum cinerariifolium]